MTKFTTFFVLNGLLNGEAGVFAHTCADEKLKDGWYWLKDGMDDPNAGPFVSKDDAERNARAQPMNYTFAHIGEGYWETKDEDEGTGDPIVTVTEKQNGHYVLTCDQYYNNSGVLKLEITQHLDRSLRTFGALLKADNAEEDRDCGPSFNRTNKGTVSTLSIDIARDAFKLFKQALQPLLAVADTDGRTAGNNFLDEVQTWAEENIIKDIGPQ